MSTFLTLAAQNVACAQPAQQFIDQQKSLEKRLDSLELKKVDAKSITKAKLTMEAMLENREDWILRLERAESDRSLLDANRQYKEMFLQTLQTLSSRGRIKFLSDDLTEKLGLKQYLCSDKYRCSIQKSDACKKIKGLYLPLVDQIFIDPHLSETEFAVSLFHEVQHAFQYRYRFPNDMSVLLHFSENDGKPIQRDDILSYLSLIYETQSAWYEIQGHQPKRWMDVTFKPDELSNVVLSTIHYGVKYVWNFLRLAVPGQTGGQPGLASFNEILPNSDKIQINRRGLPGMFPADLPNALFFRELILFGNPELISLFGNVDLAFHKRLTQAIECNYYGKLNFLFETMSGNQAIIAQTHNYFYAKFLDFDSEKFDRNGPRLCVAALEQELIDQSMSPLVYWLSADPTRIPKNCQFQFSPWNSERQSKVASIYMLQAESPFNLKGMGVEGGTGGLDITAGLFFNPQIDFSPLPAPSQEKPPQ